MPLSLTMGPHACRASLDDDLIIRYDNLEAFKTLCRVTRSSAGWERTARLSEAAIVCRRAAGWTAFEQPGISTTIMRDSQVMKAHPLLRSVGHTQLVIAGSILLGLIMGGGLTMLFRAPHSSLKTCIIREMGRQPVSMVSVQLLCAERHGAPITGAGG